MSFFLQEQQREYDENCTGTSNWTLNTGISRGASTICCGENGNDSENDLKELKSKMATMEAKNQMLEGKLEILKLLAENRALKEENNLNKLKEENKQIREKLKETEEKANQFETTIQKMQKKMEELVKEMAIQRKLGHEKKLEEVEEETREVEQNGKSKKLINPMGNGWNRQKTMATISPDGLIFKATRNRYGLQSVSAEKGFVFSANLFGQVLFYFEVTNMSAPYIWQYVGLSIGNISDGSHVGNLPNSYAFRMRDCYDCCWLSGNKHDFEWPNGATKPKWNGDGDVVGCGLLLNPAKEVSIFFTGNGILMGKQIPINSTVDTLYPTVSLLGNGKVLANFGDDSVKPFKYDIEMCPGMVFG